MVSKSSTICKMLSPLFLLCVITRKKENNYPLTNSFQCTELTGKTFKDNAQLHHPNNDCLFIKDSVFFHCNCDTLTYGGGAIFCQQIDPARLTLYLFDTSFVECRARAQVDMGGVGGGIFFESNRSFIARCCGTRCCATNAGQFLYIHCTQGHPSRMNATSCFRCPIEEKDVQNAPIFMEDGSQKISDVNSSFNEIDCLGDVFYSVQSIKIQRCTFYKNIGDCAFNIVGFNTPTVTSYCNFIGNRCGDSGVVLCEVYANGVHAFEKCVWYRNKANVAINEAKGYDVTLIGCTFDEEMKTYGSFNVEDCTVTKKPVLNEIDHFQTYFCAPNLDKKKKRFIF
ncbi:hypothetical protein TRFO_15194 [Tritrichomonas foetus]|uniref:Right handed beta helix domain-containing protein n=1 Tax=Tritrichomonas foetus TaxID=1144522 RepID=A0A1J4KU30_9EUKA|nr:hypothetical protein TRFO_15194 [Tritrichomonas foetus]|eukprot:OHT14416.1 hypothetical protein TRFO_15194 [Tritrichomonas foetus]